MLGGLYGCFDFLGLFFQCKYRCPRLGRGFELILCLETSSDDRYAQVLKAVGRAMTRRELAARLKQD